jgi:NADH-quinone oxidoreductase subunit A
MIPFILGLLAEQPSLVPPPVLLTLLLALILPTLGLFLAFVAGRVLTPRAPNPDKLARFEAGNPPFGRARGIFPMQYYPYLVVFLTVEPLVIYLFLILMTLHDTPVTVALLFGALCGMLAPPIIFALDSARRLNLWITKRTTK